MERAEVVAMRRKLRASDSNFRLQSIVAIAFDFDVRRPQKLNVEANSSADGGKHMFVIGFRGSST